MGGQYGTKNVEELLSVVKLASISILQAAAKDGFQLSDLGAFLKSEEFEKAIAPALQDAQVAFAEIQELDSMDILHLVKFGYSMFNDILTEAKLAGKKINP